MAETINLRASCLDQGVDYYLDDAQAVHKGYEITNKTELVVFEAGFEPLIIAVRSYLGGRLNPDDAVAIAANYLDEIEWSEKPAESLIRFVC